MALISPLMADDAGRLAIADAEGHTTTMPREKTLQLPLISASHFGFQLASRPLFACQHKHFTA
jgi:hypothetical protein